MPERFFGEIPGTKEGMTFDDRKALAAALIHRPVQAGISGSESEGADSIVMSGGYEDQDYGDFVIYTGHGGRDEKTGKIVADQVLKSQNLALVKSMEMGLPVRLVRGSQLKSQYAPSRGYRYDGIYFVEDYWKESVNGYATWKFKLSKLDGKIESDKPQVSEEVLTQRREIVSMRIMRDTKKSLEVKEMYDYHCQVCGIRLEGPNGPYAEAAHIRPLGMPHNGPDTLGNLLCLCPNHHILFDMRAFRIDLDLVLIGLEGKLTLNNKHQLDQSCLEYRKLHY